MSVTILDGLQSVGGHQMECDVGFDDWRLPEDVSLVACQSQALLDRPVAVMQSLLDAIEIIQCIWYTLTSTWTKQLQCRKK